jgi:TonB family protein
MPALTLANLVLFTAQAALLIGALALTLAALRPGPAFRLAACRVVLAAILVLPLQVWMRDARPALNLLDVPGGGAAAAVDGIDARSDRQLPWGTIAGGVLAAGVALRMIWLAAGLTRLRRLAGSVTGPGEPAAAGVDGEVSALQTELGTRARVAFVDRVQHPMTFGIAPAVVLLPASLLAASTDRRRAVLCHELWHVRRRDWLWVLGEELALTVLWFHPAVWWVVGELQLAREQVVDQLTVAATGARREYMDALFSAADLPSAPPLLSGFLRRRHLARRLVSLAEEVAMSRMRLVAGAVIVTVALVGSGVVGAAAWPLAPMRHATQTAAGSAASDGVVQLGRRVDVGFPDAVIASGLADAIVDVAVEIDASGAVTSARAATVTVHGGENGLGRVAVPAAVDDMVSATVDAMGSWHFRAPEVAPAKLIVTVRYAVETRQAIVTRISAAPGYATKPILHAGGAIKPPTRLVNVAPEYPQEAQDAKIQGVVILDATIAEDGSVSDVEVLKSIPQLDLAAIAAVKQWRFEPTLLNGVAVPVKITTTVNFSLAP